MQTVLTIIQAILAVTLIVVVLMQQKSAGLGGVFGGSGSIAFTRRGIDKVLHNATIAISLLFFAISIALLLV